MTGANEIRSMNRITGGEIRFSYNRHAETPREAATSVGGVAAPELDVVETIDGKIIGIRVIADELVETDEHECCRGVV